MASSNSARIREARRIEHAQKRREVKRKAKADKKKHVDDLAEEAEVAASKGNMGQVYKISKQLCGKFGQATNSTVKTKAGRVLTTEKEQRERWKQHFQEVLNRPEPEEPAEPEPAVTNLEIETAAPKEAEVLEAVLAMKNNKAPGVDMIQAEMLKADPKLSSKVLTEFFKKVWDGETIPGDWSKGIIIKIPKKGDKGNCDNWRGITLLSIPSKILCRIILKRMDKAIDKELREEQAGFRAGRGCIDQIFALRNIIEQCIEFKQQLHINFVDFRKAFDSIHRSSLWKILRSYGIPEKLVNLIAKFYQSFQCSVSLDQNKLTDWFEIKTGVRQGCILSPILFLITIDWVMRQTTKDRRKGINWGLFQQLLEDLDFADDLALLSSNHGHMQEKTDRLVFIAKKVGLFINTGKTEIITINSTTQRQLEIDGEEIKKVEKFTYLGSVLSSDNGTKCDIESRLSKARFAFSQLSTIWRSNKYSLKTKLRLYNSNVKSVMLYGSECWRVVQSEMNKVSAFHNTCLRRICKIFWPNRISNEDLFIRTNSRNIVEDIKERRLRWVGHVMRMDSRRIPKVALRWTPPGRRGRGRPKTTWRRSMEAELREMGMTWGEAEKVAKQRDQWKDCTTVALYPNPGEEN